MAKLGDNFSGSSNDTGCTPAINERIFELGCLGPALAIIILLACLKRRKHFKLEYCNGYPGLLTPVNFLRGRHNRFTIATTFGATAVKCLELFFDEKGGIFIVGGPPWVKVFQGIVSILVYGILFYPLFACMTTDHRLIGSLVGFLYVTVWFSFRVAIDFQCATSYGSSSNELVTLTIIAELPVYLCLVFIVIRFAVLLCLEVQRKRFHSPRELDKRARGIAGDPEIVHVRKLLNPEPRVISEDVKWYMKAIYFFYKPRPDFKFSTHFISTLLVTGIVVFEVLVICIGVLDILKNFLTSKCSSDDCLELWDVVVGSLQAACIISALISAMMLVHFIKSHRDHVLQLYRGQITFYQGVYISPAKLVGRSLRFSGYQIAHTVAGIRVCRFDKSEKERIGDVQTFSIFTSPITLRTSCRGAPGVTVAGEEKRFGRAWTQASPINYSILLVPSCLYLDRTRRTKHKKRDRKEREG